MITNEFGQQSITRRSLLLGSSSVAISSLLTGCASAQAETLQLLLLRGSIPAQFTGEFQKVLRSQTGKEISLNIDSQPQLQTLFAQLQAWKQSPPSPTPNCFPSHRWEPSELETL